MSTTNYIISLHYLMFMFILFILLMFIKKVFFFL